MIRAKQILSSTQGENAELQRQLQIRQKKEKLKQLMRPKSRIQKQKVSYNLEFGHEITASYRRHTNGGGHIKKIFFNKNIKSYVSYTDKELHVWNEDTGKQFGVIKFFDETQSHQISCIVYSSTHMLYLAISTDFKLYIFNEHLLLIGWIPINMRLVYIAYFHEEKSTLITGGIDGCFMFKFYAQSKYDPKQAVMLDPEGQFLTAYLGPKIIVQSTPLWIKGLKVNIKQDMIYIWSQLKVCFNSLNGKIKHKYKSLTSYENHITDIFVSVFYKYFVCSTFNGQISVFKLSKRKSHVHTFQSHLTCVNSLQEIQEYPQLFLSASNDNTIRIFSLDKFQELYCFNLPPGANKISLLSEKIFACFYNNNISLGILHNIATNFYNSKTSVIKIQQMFQSSEQKQNNNCNRIMTLFQDQSMAIQSSDDTRLISTIFPPPSAQEVVYCGYCMNLDLIFLLLLNGSICVYKIDDLEQALLIQNISSNQIKDGLGRQITQYITSATLCSTIPPKHDVEILNENAQTNNFYQEHYNHQLQKYKQDQTDRFLVVGLSKGTVLFLAVDQIELIYARFFFHKQAIKQIVEIPKHEKFVSICEEMNICVWGFSDNKSIIKSFNQIYRPVDQIICFDDNVVMTFKSGELHLFRFDNELKDLIFIKTDPSSDHDSSIKDINYFSSQGLFITGSLDCYVKIWNSKKQMLREIKFPEPINSVSFLNELGDILVGHAGKISIIKRKDYVSEEIQQTTLQSIQDLEVFYKLRAKLADSDLYLQMKQKDDLVQNKLNQKKAQQQLQIKQENDQKQINLIQQQKLQFLEKRRMEIKQMQRSKSQSPNHKQERKKIQIQSDEKSLYSQMSQEQNNDSSSYYSQSDSQISEDANKNVSIQIQNQDQQKKAQDQNQISKQQSILKASINTNQAIQNQKIETTKKIQKEVQRPQLLQSQSPIKRQTDQALLTNIKIKDSYDQMQQESFMSTLPQNSLQNKSVIVMNNEKKMISKNESQIFKRKSIESSDTPAIPKSLTEQNYQNAINKDIHKKKNQSKQTRYELTLEKIQGNILDYNDPLGKINKFSSVLLGKQNYIQVKNQNLENQSRIESSLHLKQAYSSFKIAQKDDNFINHKLLESDQKQFEKNVDTHILKDKIMELQKQGEQIQNIFIKDNKIDTNRHLIKDLSTSNSDVIKQSGFIQQGSIILQKSVIKTSQQNKKKEKINENQDPDKMKILYANTSHILTDQHSLLNQKLNSQIIKENFKNNINTQEIASLNNLKSRLTSLQSISPMELLQLESGNQQTLVYDNQPQINYDQAIFNKDKPVKPTYLPIIQSQYPIDINEENINMFQKQKPKSYEKIVHSKGDKSKNGKQNVQAEDINSEKSINIIQNGYNQQLVKQQLMPENYFQLRAESFINNKNSSFNLIPLDEKLKRKNNETVMNRRILLPEKRENTIDNKIQLKKYFSNHIDSNFKIGVTHNKSFVSYLIQKSNRDDEEDDTVIQDFSHSNIQIKNKSVLQNKPNNLLKSRIKESSLQEFGQSDQQILGFSVQFRNKDPKNDFQKPQSLERKKSNIIVQTLQKINDPQINHQQKNLLSLNSHSKQKYPLKLYQNQLIFQDSSQSKQNERDGFLGKKQSFYKKLIKIESAQQLQKNENSNDVFMRSETINQQQNSVIRLDGINDQRQLSKQNLLNQGLNQFKILNLGHTVQNQYILKNNQSPTKTLYTNI